MWKASLDYKRQTCDLVGFFSGTCPPRSPGSTGNMQRKQNLGKWFYNDALLLHMLKAVLTSCLSHRFAPGQGQVLYPQIGDKMDIVCPKTDASSSRTEEFYKVYLVSKSKMESCGVDKMDTPLLSCDKPDQDVKFTFKFQEFSPNLWGLEFLKGRDYYITCELGLDNTSGGVCRTKSMKLVLRVGQIDASGPEVDDPEVDGPEVDGPEVDASRPGIDTPGPEVDASGPGIDTPDQKSMEVDAPHSDSGLFVWVISSCVIVVLVIITLLVVLWRCHQRRSVPELQQQQQQQQQPTAVSLNTLAVPKRDSISSDNIGSDRSDAVFPLRSSESMICHHYERVSGEYGAPVYIVQEIMPQSPTNIYYKV
uniref:Ephrin B2 n=2 Tax=Nothobranchius TaxID=28779 RepID=A0A8C6LJW9_NOTFU